MNSNFMRIMATVALLAPMWWGGRVSGGITLDNTAGASSSLPARALLPVTPIDEIPVANGAASPQSDANDVLGGIVANTAQKPGAPAILNEVTKAHFANTENLSAAPPEQIAPARKTGGFVWLGVLAGCVGLATVVSRKIMGHTGSKALTPRIEVAGNREVPKLDQPRLI